MTGSGVLTSDTGSEGSWEQESGGSKAQELYTQGTGQRDSRAGGRRGRKFTGSSSAFGGCV